MTRARKAVLESEYSWFKISPISWDDYLLHGAYSDEEIGYLYELRSADETTTITEEST